MEGARERLGERVSQGISYDSEEMAQAYQNFTALETQWKALEEQHLDLRDEILREKNEKG